jgi:hypothetical protein
MLRPCSDLPAWRSLLFVPIVREAFVAGMSGFAAKTGFPDREPMLPPTALADMVAGL